MAILQDSACHVYLLEVHVSLLLDVSGKGFRGGGGGSAGGCRGLDNGDLQLWVHPDCVVLQLGDLSSQLSRAALAVSLQHSQVQGYDVQGQPTLSGITSLVGVALQLVGNKLDDSLRTKDMVLLYQWFWQNSPDEGVR